MSQITLADGFVFDFPVWVAVNPDRYPEIGLDAYIGMSDPIYGMLFVFFTDESLAEEAVANEPALAGTRAQQVDDPAALEELTEISGYGGCTKIIIDGTTKGTAKSRAYELNEFLRDFRISLSEEN